jgi:hypothetical protein
MKIRYLLMTVMVMVATLDSASLALNTRRSSVASQPSLVQPQAEKRVERPMMLTDWVQLSGRVYQMRQRLR